MRLNSGAGAKDQDENKVGCCILHVTKSPVYAVGSRLNSISLVRALAADGLEDLGSSEKSLYLAETTKGAFLPPDVGEII